jgi:L-ribulose-5-phosphate 3-epimerase
MESMPRRRFLEMSALGGLAAATASGANGQQKEKPKTQLFRISLAQWSFHRALFGGDPGEMMGWDEFERRLHTDKYRSLLGGSMKPLDFAARAKKEFNIDAIEYVNVFFFDRARDSAFLAELKKRADSEGVRSVQIMCDGLGEIGDPDTKARTKVAENHFPWVEAAAYLGCHAIRVNAASDARLPREEQQKLVADGLRRLAEFADARKINVLVENHGGLSSNARWLAGIMKMVGHPRVGTLPDFGNYQISEKEEYDRYLGIKEMMPFAKGVSAKSYDFDEKGNETKMDYTRIMKVVLDAGFRGYVGIEYEGTRLSEADGIRATQKLLVRIREQLASSYA